jgi:hypothetical protein
VAKPPGNPKANRRREFAIAAAAPECFHPTPFDGLRSRFALQINRLNRVH